MREHKYRAWDKEHECYHYDILEFGDKQENGLYLITIADKIYDYTIGKLELEQYIGTLDFCGEYIYKNDIVSANGADFLQVLWNNGYCCYEARRGDYGSLGFRLILLNEFNVKYFKMEVVGNIHENEELLK